LRPRLQLFNNSRAPSWEYAESGETLKEGQSLCYNMNWVVRIKNACQGAGEASATSHPSMAGHTPEN